MSKNKVRYYPLKPKTIEGFKKAVAWFGGREFIASLKGLLVYELYGGNIDPRSWMKPNIFPDVQEKLESRKANISKDEHGSVSDKEINLKVNEYWKNKVKEQWTWKRERFEFWDKYLEKSDFGKKLDNGEFEELWFDFIADTGDGQMGVYSVACLCHSDLWLEEDKIESEIKFRPPFEKAKKNNDSNEIKRKNDENKEVWDLTDDFNEKTLLPRGSFLFIGGDTAYHSADYATIFERFQSPFRWAFISVRKYLWENYEIKDPKAIGEDCFADQEQQQQRIRVQEVFKNKSTDDKAITEAEVFNKKWDGTFGKYGEKKLKNGIYGPCEMIPINWDTEPSRPLFGIPANHDYYDALAGFNKQFRRPPYKNIEENLANADFVGGVPLKIHSFAREQEASYTALHLPFKWWMFGLDSEYHELDHRQKVFYEEIVKRWKPRKLILATPEPTTVFGKKCSENDKTAKYLAEITRELGYRQPFLNDGKFVEIPDEKNSPANTNKKNTQNAQKPFGKNVCRLDLSGDIHHYARYWGPNVPDTIAEDYKTDEVSSDNYASLVAGGGGAFFDSTDTLIGERKVEKEDGEIKTEEGEVPPQAIYPGKSESIKKLAGSVFDLWNIKKGGYIQNVGGIVSMLIFFFLTQDYSNVTNTFFNIDHKLKTIGFSGIFARLSDQGRFVDFVFSNNGITYGILLFVGFLFWCSGFLIGGLIKKLAKLEDENLTEKLEADNRLKHLLSRFIPMLSGLSVYAILFLSWKANIDPIKANSYNNSWFLLFHLALAGILIWVSIKYNQWLKIRQKISRSTLQRSVLQQMRDPNSTPTGWSDHADNLEIIKQNSNIFKKFYYFIKIFILRTFRKQFISLQKYIGSLSRQYLFEYIPDSILYILATIIVFLGVGIFGKGELLRTLSDILFIIMFFGLFVLVSVKLGRNTGGQYQDSSGKKLFLIIGTFHASLQVLTPFVLVYYGNWIFLIVVYFVFTAFNGVALNKPRFKLWVDEFKYLKQAWLFFEKFTIPDHIESRGAKISLDWIQRFKKSNIGGKIISVLSLNWGRQLMKNESKYFPYIGLGLGLFILIFPLFLTFYCGSKNSAYQLILDFYKNTGNHLVMQFFSYIDYLTNPIFQTLGNNKFISGIALKHIEWLPILTVLAVIGYIGYKMSRIWLSWYLGISLTYNGHNNEAGGLARIEDYKHILRIRVKNDGLTVYVIGFDEAKSNLVYLNPKLVDKFELKYQKSD